MDKFPEPCGVPPLLRPVCSGSATDAYDRGGVPTSPTNASTRKLRALRIRHSAVLLSVAAALPLFAADPDTPLFPPVAALEPALTMPEGASFAIGEDGSFLVDGRPRYLLGTLFYLGSGADQLRPGPGYAPEFSWIYETPPARDYLQRLGFDTVGGEVSASWMRRYRPEKSFWRASRVVDWPFASNHWHGGLPTIVDFTAATWSHGGLSFQKGREPAFRAFVDDPDGRCHFLSYSLVSDEGRALWSEFWRTGAEELRDHGAKPYAYELFNEPRYDDRSPAAREAFAAFLSERFGGDPAAMDAAWGSAYGSFEAAAAFEKTGVNVGLGVEWLKFREAAFEGGVRLGRETIRAVDPGARVCYQPLGRSVDVDRVIGAETWCDVVMSPTGGGDPWDDMRLLALADGKPFIDGETYLGRTRVSHRAAILRQFARGMNASYYFKWERRLGEMKAMDDASLQRLADRFPWLGLNPAAVPPEALAGLMDAKRDIAAVQDLFGPRGRGIPPAKRVAVLSSLPTARLAEAAGLRCHALEREAALALAVGAHVPVDAIFEEQLPEGRLDRYNVLVAAGVAATYPATRGILRDWVERGGTLILVGEAMELDEYARPSPSDFPGVSLGEEIGGEPRTFRFAPVRPTPRPVRTYEAVPYREISFDDGWRTLAEFSDGRPIVADRRVGHGAIVYIGVRFADAIGEGGLLAALADNSIFPTCETVDPATGEPVPDIEVHAARGKGGAVGFVVENRGLAPRAVRFFPRGFFLAPALADVSRRVILGTDHEGAVLLLLEPNVPVVLRCGTRSSVEAALAAAPRGWNEGAPAWDTREKTHAESAELESHAESAEFAESNSHAEQGDSADPLADVRPDGLAKLRVEPYAEVAAHAASWLAAHTSASRARAKAFSVDPARVKFLDLRAAATMPYGDKVADDGRGGWTDQGDNCLRNVPWGTVDCNGVPFDFIRPDQNGDRAALILRSARQPWLPECATIPAGLRAEAVFFLHAGAFLEEGAEAFRYDVHYADGTCLEVPVRGFREVGDWWHHGPARRDTVCVPGWLNAESRGFHVWRWENPFPEKTIDSIDVVSACTGAIPIVEAVSVLAAPEDLRVEALAVPKANPWGGARCETLRRDGNLMCLDLAEARDRAGVKWVWPEPFEVPAGFGRADLEFDVLSGDGAPLPPLQAAVGQGGYVPIDSLRTAAGRVAFPLDLSEGGLHAPVPSVSLQLTGERPAGTAKDLIAGEFRVVMRDEPESPLSLRRIVADGRHGVRTIRRDGGIELAVDDRTEDWAYARLRFVRPVALPEDPATAVLAFDANGGRTPLGRRDRGRQRFRVRATCTLADGAEADGEWVRDPPIEDGPIDEDPWSWQTVRVPLNDIVPDRSAAIADLRIQFTGLPAGAERAGLLVRNFRFEPRN